MSKYFVYMYIDDARMGSLLNLAILILNPRERWPAHVTIAGPFARKLEVPRALTFVQQVHLLGRGRFDSELRHTVFLHVGSRDMGAHIEKPDYPQAVPHLSLYNGPDKETADLLFAGLGNVRPYGLFYSKKLEIVESKQQYSFNFKLSVDTAILPSARRRTLEELAKLSKEERVQLALDAIHLALRPRFDLKQALRSA